MLCTAQTKSCQEWAIKSCPIILFNYISTMQTHYFYGTSQVLTKQYSQENTMCGTVSTALCQEHLHEEQLDSLPPTLSRGCQPTFALYCVVPSIVQDNKKSYSDCTKTKLSVLSSDFSLQTFKVSSYVSKE